MRVLITFGSKRGGTAGIAKIIGEVLREDGLEVDVVPAGKAGDPTAYDAVLVGGALYAGRWHRDARWFVRRYAETLQEMPVWLFSSGPLGDVANRSDIAPTKQVQGLMRLVGARGHITFGGRLAKDARGFIAKTMAKKLAGDWRDVDRIHVWAQQVGMAVRDEPARVRTPHRGVTALRWLTAGLCLFAGLTAIAGGAALVAAPDGSIIQMPVSALSHSPFSDFLVPGLLLLGVIGLSNTAAGIVTLRRHALADEAAFFSGGALAVWVAVELVLLRTVHWLQVAYLLLGLTIQLLALVHRQRVRRPAARAEPVGGVSLPHLPTPHPS